MAASDPKRTFLMSVCPVKSVHCQRPTKGLPETIQKIRVKYSGKAKKCGTIRRVCPPRMVPPQCLSIALCDQRIPLAGETPWNRNPTIRSKVLHFNVVRRPDASYEPHSFVLRNRKRSPNSHSDAACLRHVYSRGDCGRNAFGGAAC